MIADVETREMIELEPVRVGQQRLEIRRGIIAVGAEADEMLVARAVAKLHQAQPVAAGNQAHRLGIDRDRPARRTGTADGQVFFVKMDRHDRPVALAVAAEPR